MALTRYGDVCADLGKQPEGSKSSRYKRIGVAFKDDAGRIVIKIDTLPLPQDTWSGWTNIFPKEDKSTTAPPAGSRLAQLEDDDIPF